MSKTDGKPLAEVDLSKLKPGAILEFPSVGLPGFRQIITFQLVYSDPRNPSHSESYEGNKGKYKVVFTFSRPGMVASSARTVQYENRKSADIRLPVYSSIEIQVVKFNNFTRRFKFIFQKFNV